MRMLLVLFLAVASHIAAAAETRRLEIEGVGLGDSIAHVKSAWRDAKCPERKAREDGPYNCMALNTSVQGQAATLIAALGDDGKVARVILRDLDPGAFGIVTDAIVARLGAPASDASHARIDPRYGAPIPNRSVEWKRDGITLAGSQYATASSSLFTLERRPTAADIEARAAKRLREGD
jgi:hypothetical protein